MIRIYPLHNSIRPRLGQSRAISTGKNDSASTKMNSFAVGAGAGLLGSLVGLGGGFVMIPFLSSPLIGLSQHAAHGTSLLAVTTTGLAGGASYFWGKRETIQNPATDQTFVDLHSAMAISFSGIITARLGAKMSGRLSQKVLKKILGFSMIAVSPLVSLKSYQMNTKKTSNVRSGDVQNMNWENVVVSCSIGLCSGFTAGLLGVGGGAIVVPALTFFTNMSHHCALGTSLTAMVLPAFAGTYTHFKLGNVDKRIAPFLAVGSLAGAFGGGQLGLQIEEDTLRYGFSGLMLCLGLRTITKA